MSTNDFLRGQRHSDAPGSAAPEGTLPERQERDETQPAVALGITTSGGGQNLHGDRQKVAPAGQTSDRGHPENDAPEEFASVGSDAATGARRDPVPNQGSRPSLFDPTLYTLASLLDDIEGIRKANANRTRILTATEPDEDGVQRGFGLDETHPAVSTLTALGAQLEALEHGTVLALNRAMRQHPLAAYQKQARGVGEKQLARLLAAVGDPYLRTMPDGSTVPRTVSQLWAYCGLHTIPVGQRHCDDHVQPADGGTSSHPAGTKSPPQSIRASSRPGETEAARRRKGQQANWSTDAKTRAYLIATSCIKSGGEYRAVYDQRRALTAATHPDWTPGHSHNDALRIVSKRILRDLWRAARDYHMPEPKEQAA